MLTTLNCGQGQNNLIYYVRPAGTTYGNGSGTSYANAWSGFSAINWSLLSKGKLAVCGTHLETLTIGTNDVTIIGNDINESGYIDGKSVLDICLNVSSKNNVTINNMTLYNAVTSCLNIEGTSTNVVTNNMELYGSGNQGVQHLNTVVAYHYNIHSYSNFDDGVSGHNSSTIYLYGGLLEKNAQNINYIDTVSVYAYNVTIQNGGTESVFPNGNTYSEYHNCIILDNNIQCSATSTTLFENCLIKVLSTINGTATYNYCVFEGGARITTNNVGAIYNLNWCLFRNTTLTGATQFVDTSATLSATVNIKYCVFDNIITGRNAVVKRANTTMTLTDSTFVGNNKLGNGISVGSNLTIQNCIFTNCAIGVTRTAGTVSTENCCFYNNTSNTSGTVTQVSSVTGNPNLVSIVTNNYSLGVGSSCIGTGKTLVNNIGIATANWGNSTTTTPIVTTKTQNTNWDIGAYLT